MAEHTSEKEPAAKAAPQAASQRAGTVAGPGGQMLALQAGAGNAAVARLVSGRRLARDPKKPTPEELLAEAKAAQDAANQATAKADEAKKQAEDAERGAAGAKIQAEGALSVANAALAANEMQELRRLVGNRLNRAYTAYVSACKDVKSSLKEAAKARAEMAGMVLEIFVGHLAPGLGKGLAKMASNIPTNASNMTYRIAIAALNTDQTKELFKSAAKVGSQTIKWNSSQLFGEVDGEQFTTKLEVLQQKVMDAMDADLKNRSAAELGILYAAFDPDLCNVEVYRGKVKRLVDLYLMEVADIGETQFSMSNHYSSPPRVAWIQIGNSKKLALVQWKTSFLHWGNWWFLRWVSGDMKSLALSKGRSTQNKKIEVLPQSEVKLMPAIGIEEWSKLAEWTEPADN